MEFDIKIPDDRPTWETEIANYWFDGPILVSLSKSCRRTVTKISANVEAVRNITGNKRVPLLIYLADSPVPDAETRKFSAEQLPVIYSAMAMVSQPGLARLVMDLVFRFKAPPIPMKSFTNYEDARKWLMQFAQGH